MTMEVTIEELNKILGHDATEFISVMAIVDDILENNDKYTGIVALKTANKLAAFRTKIAAKAAYYKTRENSADTRKRKNILISMEHALEENINALKLLGKVDGRFAGML